jgi:prepilin-type N-terminal cleavage/methylation domain-containing protein
MKRLPTHQSGFTLAELLVALLIVGAITAASFNFYKAEHNNMIVQENVSDMQTSLRSSLDEIVRTTRNAGANLPSGISPILVTNTNPDTLEIRYAAMGCNATVGDHTQKQQANPIFVDKGSDLSCYTVGDKLFLWHTTLGFGEYFVVTKLSTNKGTGWEEIHHGLADLSVDPVFGDVIVKMQAHKYFIDQSNKDHPRLMRSINGEPAQIYADNITDFQARFVLTNGDSVQALAASDTVATALLSMFAHTELVDAEAVKFGNDGRRTRHLGTEVVLRNNRFK